MREVVRRTLAATGESSRLCKDLPKMCKCWRAKGAEPKISSTSRCRTLPLGTFAIKCPSCGSSLRLIALVETEAVVKKILTAMHLPTEVPELHPARPPPTADRDARNAEDWLN